MGAAPTSGPAAAFLSTWASTSSYSADIKVHETKGSDIQDRTYHIAYLKPHFARLDITGGPGKGGGAVWHGGDTVSGHQGGFLSGIHLTVSVHDGRATDLRGATIDEASFQNMAYDIAKAPTLSAVEEAGLDGVTFPFTGPNGATKRTIWFSKTTHLPVRRVTYTGDTIVVDEQFTNVNAAAGLKESDF